MLGCLCWGSLENVVFVVTFIALAYEGNELSPSNIEGSHKLLCLVLNTEYKKELKTGMLYFSFALHLLSYSGTVENEKETAWFDNYF